MKKIKILYTIPNFDTAGSGKALLNIAKRLNKNRFDVHIMCLHNRGKFYKEVEQSGIPLHIYPYISPSRPYTALALNVVKVARKFRTLQPHIIHSFHYAADYTEVLAARLAGVQWIFTKKNMNWGGASKNAWWLRSKLANRIAVQNTDMICQFYPNSKKIELIPRGVDITYFHILSSYTSDLIPSFPNKNLRYVVCIANMVPVKGIEFLIKAFNQLHEQHVNWRLNLVGDINSSYGEELEQLVRNLKLGHKIEFSGKVMDVRPYLHRAEIFVLPTRDKGRREGSPVALLEAMASGKVVLGTNIPGIRDQLKNFPDYLVAPENVNDLWFKLNLLMEKGTQELDYLGKIFASYVQSHHTIEMETKKHEEMYLEVAL